MKITKSQLKQIIKEEYESTATLLEKEKEAPTGEATPEILEEVQKLLDLADELFVQTRKTMKTTEIYTAKSVKTHRGPGFKSSATHASDIWVEDLRRILKERYDRIKNGYFGKPPKHVRMSLGRTYGRMFKNMAGFFGDITKVMGHALGITKFWPSWLGGIKEASEPSEEEVASVRDGLARPVGLIPRLKDDLKKAKKEMEALLEEEPELHFLRREVPSYLTSDFGIKYRPPGLAGGKGRLYSRWRRDSSGNQIRVDQGATLNKEAEQFIAKYESAAFEEKRAYGIFSRKYDSLKERIQKLEDDLKNAKASEREMDDLLSQIPTKDLELMKKTPKEIIAAVRGAEETLEDMLRTIRSPVLQEVYLKDIEKLLQDIRAYYYANEPDLTGEAEELLPMAIMARGDYLEENKMKITRAQLKQIIKEEMKSVQERFTPETHVAYKKLAKIQKVFENPPTPIWTSGPGTLDMIEQIKDILTGGGNVEPSPEQELDEIFGLGKKDKEEEDPRLKKAKKRVKKAEKSGERMGKKQSGFDMRMQALGLEENK